jgi:hypothetical protein
MSLSLHLRFLLKPPGCPHLAWSLQTGAFLTIEQNEVQTLRTCLNCVNISVLALSSTQQINNNEGLVSDGWASRGFNSEPQPASVNRDEPSSYGPTL